MAGYFIEKIVSSEQLKQLLRLRIELESRDIPYREVFYKILETARPIQKQKFPCNTIVFDLDGTVSNFTADIRGVGTIFPEAKKLITELKELGFRIGIYTARPNKQKHIINNFFKSFGLEVDFINIDPKSVWKTAKPVSMLYIDDRAFRFSGDWRRDIETLKDYIKYLRSSNE